MPVDRFVSDLEPLVTGQPVEQGTSLVASKARALEGMLEQVRARIKPVPVLADDLAGQPARYASMLSPQPCGRFDCRASIRIPGCPYGPGPLS